MINFRKMKEPRKITAIKDLVINRVPISAGTVVGEVRDGQLHSRITGVYRGHLEARINRGSLRIEGEKTHAETVAEARAAEKSGGKSGDQAQQSKPDSKAQDAKSKSGGKSG